VDSEGAVAHRAFEAMWERMCSALDGARLERRCDLIVSFCRTLPVPQFNGPWVVEDTQTAVDALASAVAEVDATGVRTWVQTRAGHQRTQRAAVELGLTHAERIPGMVMLPGELVEAHADIEIGLVGDDDVEEANTVLVRSFGGPRDVFDQLGRAVRRTEEMSWYLARSGGEIVSTGLGFTVDGVTGVFDVATPPELRGRGYGAAVTSQIVRDGFDGGSELAFLQSSELGHGVYRRLGFREVEEYVLLTRPFAE
jgi:ribosomal protein S18 acetylase RimI-like enzyme